MARSPAQLRAIFAALRGKGTLSRARKLVKVGALATRRTVTGKLALGAGKKGYLWSQPTLKRALGGLKPGVRPFNSALQKQGKIGMYKGGVMRGSAFYHRYGNSARPARDPGVNPFTLRRDKRYK